MHETGRVLTSNTADFLIVAYLHPFDSLCSKFFCSLSSDDTSLAETFIYLQRSYNLAVSTRCQIFTLFVLSFVMSVSVSIHPSSDQLVMFGEPDATTSYSLSGYVELSISPSFLSRRKSLSLSLHSLVLTFEGQCETVSSQAGYHAIRVCSITHELVSGAPIELDITEYEDEPCRWRIVFDLNIPGWLPSTSPFSSDDELGTRYALYASAQLFRPEGGPASDWSFLNLCMPWFSRPRFVKASKEINVERVVTSGNSSLTSYLISNHDNQSTSALDIPSKLQILASVPKYVDVNANEIPLALRMRTKELEHGICEDIRIVSIYADFLQTESVGPQPPDHYKNLLPPKASQPPNLPLLQPHPVAAVYDLGLDQIDNTSTFHHAHSFLPSRASGNYTLAGDNTIHSNDSDSASATWLTLDVAVPFIQQRPSKDYHHFFTLRPTCSQPLFSTQHSLVISLTCSYVTSEHIASTEVFKFSIPVRLANFAPEPLYPCAPSNIISTRPAEALPSLPPYSQLFHQNGERRTDNTIPLPLYTPPSEAAFEDSSKLLNG